MTSGIVAIDIFIKIKVSFLFKKVERKVTAIKLPNPAIEYTIPTRLFDNFN